MRITFLIERKPLKQKITKTITTMTVSILLATSILSVLSEETIPSASAAHGDRHGFGTGEGGIFDGSGGTGGGGGGPSKSVGGGGSGVGGGETYRCGLGGGFGSGVGGSNGGTVGGGSCD